MEHATHWNYFAAMNVNEYLKQCREDSGARNHIEVTVDVFYHVDEEGIEVLDCFTFHNGKCVPVILDSKNFTEMIEEKYKAEINAAD